MNSFIVAMRLIKEVGNDKRTIAMFFLAPVFIISLLYIVINNGIETVNIGTPEAFPLELSSETVVQKSIPEAEMLSALEDETIDAYGTMGENGLYVTLEGTDPTISGKVLQNLRNALSNQLQNQLEASKLPVTLPSLHVTYVYGEEDMKTFDRMAPFMMAFVVFFLVFLLSGISFLRERISGTMVRMMATAVRRRDIVLGYILGFGFFVFLQTVIIQFYMTHVLKIHNEGNLLLALVINLFVAACSLSLGLLLSAFARNEFQLFQFIPLVIIPQTLFAGLFPLRETPKVIHWLSKAFPLTYGGEALRDVILRGKGFSSVVDELLILLGFIMVFLILNIRVLKKYRGA